MLYLGIDPGVNIQGPGAIAMMDDSGTILGTIDIPIVKVKGRAKLDLRALYHDFQELVTVRGKGDTVFLVVVEEPQMIPGKRGGFAIAKANHCFGAIEMMLTVMGLPYLPVKPAIWKKAVLDNTQADKGDSILSAKGMFPNCHALLKRKKDHNRAEAMLMAFYSLVKSGRARLVV